MILCIIILKIMREVKMPNTELTEEFIFIEEVHTRVLELNSFVKILCSVVHQEDEFYYLQDFISLILCKQSSLVDFIDEALAKPIFPVLKQK